MKRKSFGWQLPVGIENRLGEDSYGRQRAIYEEDHLLIILHAVPSEEELEREAVVFLRMPDGPLWCNGHDGGESRMRQLLSAYRECWNELDRAYEQAQSASDLFKVIARLVPLNRASTNLASALQAAREFVRQDKFLISMRDEAYEVSRAFDLLMADAKLALDYRLALNAEQQADKTDAMAHAQHKLNILAAMTFPLMAMATLLGMNLSHGLEERSPWLFVMFLAIGLGIGFGVRSWVTKSGKKE